jgi:hypothetical protein
LAKASEDGQRQSRFPLIEEEGPGAPLPRANSDHRENAANRGDAPVDRLLFFFGSFAASGPDSSSAALKTSSECPPTSANSPEPSPRSSNALPPAGNAPARRWRIRSSPATGCRFPRARFACGAAHPQAKRVACCAAPG